MFKRKITNQNRNISKGDKVLILSGSKEGEIVKFLDNHVYGKYMVSYPLTSRHSWEKMDNLLKINLPDTKFDEKIEKISNTLNKLIDHLELEIIPKPTKEYPMIIKKKRKNNK